MKVLFRALACMTLLVALPVMAEGDAARGEELSITCAACHGVDGNSTLAMWPKLAGQHQAYLVRQLGLIKGGGRFVAEMAGIVTTLSDQDMEDMSAYFSNQESRPAVADPAMISQGERIYRAGNPESGVPACMACHGPAGEGNPLAGYPALAGQHSVYLGKMLTGFKSGTTWGDEDEPSIVMAEVASPLSEAEITAVSGYIQGLYSKGNE